MAKQSPTLYSIPKTFMWFTVVSLVLTASLVGIVWLDYSREWKSYQKQFFALKYKMAQDELKKSEKNVDQKRLKELQNELREARQVFDSHRVDYGRVQREAETLVSKIAKAKSQYQTAKQYEDSYRYYLEEMRLHQNTKGMADYEKKLSSLTPQVRDYKEAQESLEKEKDSADARLAQFSDKEKALQKQIDKVLEEKNRLEKRQKKLAPSLVKDILNAPMVDFIAPTLQIQQVVLADLQEDYHFAKVQKVDRCMTCHLGIDQKGFENAPQPFRTHPKLDLYLGTASPHPLEKMGCTSCHGGSGQALSFIETAHTPNEEAQEKLWRQKHAWHELEGWDNKMLPLKNVQAACVKCHQGVVEVPQADQLNRGRHLAGQMGCFNCHKINGYEERWKVGPDLTHIQSKLGKEWIEKWLEDPAGFRPSSRMPKIFHLSNTSSPEEKEKNDAAIQSIAEYLIKNSGTVPLTRTAKAGDPSRGEKFVKDLGCLACHSAAGVTKAQFGPELSNLGSKVTPEWLFSWLRDPKHYSKNTRMPNLRLSDEEASDIAAYLLSQKNEPFDQKAAPRAKSQVVDQMILESMQGALRASEARAELQKMSPEDKMQFLGKKSIAHQGCFGCHNIQGFEDAKPIGAELSDEGRKDLSKFDFAFVDIEKTRQAWIHQKLKDPRSFDRGKIKPYYEKLRMPQFNFSEEELAALETFVLSLSEEQIPLQMKKRLDLNQARIEKGRFMVQQFNCNGCHALDGQNGLLRELAEDPGATPPILDGEGAKAEEKWLHDFLKSPSPIRPWLHTRMPTFDFSEEELNSLVLYFHHLAHQEITFGDSVAPPTTDEALKAGKALFDTFQCVKCHQLSQDSAAMGTSFLAPDLTMAKHRLKPDWVIEWLKDPQTLQEGTMMPTYFTDGQTPVADVLGGDAQKQIKAIRDYLYRYESSAESEVKKQVAK